MRRTPTAHISQHTVWFLGVTSSLLSLGLSACPATIEEAVLQCQLLNIHRDIGNRDFSWTTLHSAAALGYHLAGAHLLKHEMNSYSTTEKGQTPLAVAARRGHHRFVKLLLDDKTDPNISDHKGFTPLMHAAFMGHAEVIRQLCPSLSFLSNLSTDELIATTCRRRAAIESKNSAHKTALHLAAERGHEDAVTALLDAGATYHIHTTEARVYHDFRPAGLTPLELASQARHTAVVACLLSHYFKEPEKVENGVFYELQRMRFEPTWNGIKNPMVVIEFLRAGVPSNKSKNALAELRKHPYYRQSYRAYKNALNMFGPDVAQLLLAFASWPGTPEPYSSETASLGL